MELSASQRQRLHEKVQEIREILGGCLHPDGRPKTFPNKVVGMDMFVHDLAPRVRQNQHAEFDAQFPPRQS